MVWGSNVPQTRTPDAHFYTEVRQGHQDRSRVQRLRRNGQVRRHLAGAQAGHRRRAGHGHGPCDPEGIPPVRRLGLLPRLRAPLHRHAHAGAAQERDGRHVPDHFLRASHLDGALGEQNNPDWKTLVYDEDSGDLVAPNGSIGFRWGEGAVNGGEKVGRWNLEARDGGSGRDITPRLSLIDQADAVGRGLPVLRRRARRAADAQCGAPHPPGGRHGRAGRHRVRPADGQLRPGSRPGRRQCRHVL